MKKSFLSAIALLFVFLVLTGCTDSSLTQNDSDDKKFDPEARLQELGITLPEPPQPVANYVNGLRSQRFRGRRPWKRK